MNWILMFAMLLGGVRVIDNPPDPPPTTIVGHCPNGAPECNQFWNHNNQ
jgi:hypothetical protein